MAEALRPFRGGWYVHPFATTWYILEFLKGNPPYGTERIDPQRGAHQAHIHQQYKIALRRAVAEDQVARDQEELIARGLPQFIDAEQEARTQYYFYHQPRRLHRMRYASFTVYFSLLKRLGWVEPTGEQRPSEPQDYDENFQPRIYYRLTAEGMAADVPREMFDPIMALYPHYTREFRSRRQAFPRVPGLPVRPRRPRPAFPAPAAPTIKEPEVAEEAAPGETPQDLIARLQGIPDEEKKARSLKRLEDALEDIDPDMRLRLEGLENLESAIVDYHETKPKGMIPEDYQAEKESAWVNIQSSLEELKALE